MDAQLDALLAYPTRLRSSADLWAQALPPEMSDMFSMTGAVSFHPGRREVHVHLTDAPLLMQNSKLRDAFYNQTGQHYMTTGEAEKLSPLHSDHMVLSEGALLWVPDEDGVSQAALTQRSYTNPKTGEMVLSPGAWQNPRGKMQDNQTYKTELGEELLVLTEVQKDAGQIGLTSLLVRFNGGPAVSVTEKQEQLKTYEAFLNKERGPSQPFKAAAVSVREETATLHTPDLEAAWKIVTFINNRPVREIPGLPLLTTETNSFEFSVPLVLPHVTTRGMRLVAMEPGPQQPTAFQTREQMLAMPLAAKRPKAGEVMGGLNQALFGPLRGLTDDRQIAMYNKMYGSQFNTSALPRVA